jgi:cytidine deaminase
MKRDEGLSDRDSPFSPAPPKKRVSIRKTFALADVFVSLEEASAARRADQSGVLERFVHKLFDEPFHTPTRDELGMAHAYVAARRSGSLARHVGAALCTPDGDVLSVGTNEVPAATGGQYWPTYDGGSSDGRDHAFVWRAEDGSPFTGADSNDLIKAELAKDFAQRILGAIPSTLEHDSSAIALFDEYVYNAERLIPLLLANPDVAGAKLFDVIEYSRQVHAEMAALMSCARRGIPTAGAVLYCTTFPCHECSRHLIAAGISRIVYVEPYEKSRVSELHPDSVDVELYAGRDPNRLSIHSDRVSFEPFIGISPDRQADLYAFTRRKHEAGINDLDRVGRARPWTFGPRCPLRKSIASDEATIGIAELLKVAASEHYISKSLERRGIDPTRMARPPESSDSPVASSSGRVKGTSDV